MEKNKKLIAIFIMVIAVLSISTGTFLLINNKDKESGKENNTVDPDKPEPNKVVYDGFTFAFLKLETNKNNMVYSPLSVKYALSMLSEGANGETKTELDNLLKDLTLTKYDNIDKVLSLANSMFIRDSYKDKVKSEYIDTLTSKYNAEVKYDSFENASNVNKWIEEKTFKIIKNMLQDELVQNPELEMLLINALAIDMGWELEFQNEDTRSQEFTKIDNQKINVAMMSMTTNSKSVKYHKDDVYTAVSLPLKKYSGTQLEFIAVMPNDAILDNTLTSDNLNQTMNSLMDKLKEVESGRLNIQIPRFDFEYKTNLNNDLMALGVKKAFTDEADFSKIANTDLSVGEVLHKANVKITEKGVKAAAATVITMKDNAVEIQEPEEITVLKFDKPFLFVIRDMNTGEVWFVGSVYEPQLWDTVKDNY